MPGKKKSLLYLHSKNKYIKDFTYTGKNTSVKFISGYSDPKIIPTSGVRYKGIKEIIVGELFLLGKVY